MPGKNWLLGALFCLLLCVGSVGQAAGAAYRQGDSGPVVEQIQVGLKNAGYFGGRVDGNYNVLTRQAVLAFQKARGLKPDGVVEEKTFRILTGKKLPSKPAAQANPATGGKNATGILHTALSYRGVKYRFGGATPSGFDCSGFVMYVYNRHGVKLPRTADKQYEIGRKIRQNDLKPGDLVFFETYEKGASHVGIYQGNGQFVHASSSRGVTVSRLSETYYAKRYLGARRVL